MKRVYITGICGLLGNNIANVLKSQYEIFGVDLFETNMENCVIENFDLLNFTKLRESIERVRPDIVIHTAASVNVDACEINTELAYKLNVELTKVIADVCNMLNIKMIYISTDAVYSGEDKGLYTETSSVDPQNVYGKTKYLGERYVQKLKNGLILRTNIYGLNIQNKNSFGEWIVKSLMNNETLYMFTDISFSPILVTELAEVIDACISKNISGLYNACATGAISKFDFGCKVKAIMEISSGEIIPADSSTKNFVAKRSKNMGMSNGKICEALGIHISTPEESIFRFREELLAREGALNEN